MTFHPYPGSINENMIHLCHKHIDENGQDAPITLEVYDFFDFFFPTLFTYSNLGVDVVYHASIKIYGLEFFYTPNISVDEFTDSIDHIDLALGNPQISGIHVRSGPSPNRPLKSICIGTTKRTPEQILLFLTELANTDYSKSKFDMFNHNSVTFVTDLAAKLCSYEVDEDLRTNAKIIEKSDGVIFENVDKIMEQFDPMDDEYVDAVEPFGRFTFLTLLRCWSTRAYCNYLIINDGSAGI